MTDVTTEVDGRTLKLTNLGKVLYPSGFTKGEVIDYYRRIAPVMLPHLAGRPVTRIRFPNGTQAPSFFEKNVPAGTPEWVTVHHVAGSREDIDYPLVDSLATLVWLANLAALELHTHQWRAAPGASATELTEELLVDQLVLDLDPGPGVAMPLIASAALLVAGALADDRLLCHVKTSGSKGLQLYAALEPTPAGRVITYARALGARLAAAHPELFLTEIAKAARPGKILVDVNQNLAGRNTVCAYSLRAKDAPTVSTPLAWDEVEDAAAGGSPLRFEAADVLDRVEAHGDLFAPLLTGARGVLPA
ncbi:non-homologous end-joining DNA ligase [Propioniciclava sp.]|uniref:non-homologous end-joining DNA ligase n=1 Tax=Propioniciclava sp. TaxID=2038686 RepID=UPI002636011B|nr:non-homologous end-joining DNA ligase [Propioniciclava sp.]